MRLVTIRALGVAGGGRASFGRMTRLAIRLDGAAVRLVALLARRVLGARRRGDGGVTRFAAGAQALRMVRQSLVAALTLRMT